MTQFITAQELLTYLTGETISSPADDEWVAQADALIEMISADVQAAARNRIVRGTDVAVKLAGTWSRDLDLPQRPVVAVTSVALNGTTISAGEFEWNERSLIRRGGEIGTDGVSPLDGAHWGGPASTVAVTYTYGYATADVPDVVKSLVKRVAARTIGNTGGVSQETLGPYSVSYGNVLAAGGSHVTKHEAKMLRKRFSTTAGTFASASRG